MNGRALCSSLIRFPVRVPVTFDLPEFICFKRSKFTDHFPVFSFSHLGPLDTPPALDEENLYADP